jgi:hypothetical protein
LAEAFELRLRQKLEGGVNDRLGKDMTLVLANNPRTLPAIAGTKFSLEHLLAGRRQLVQPDASVFHEIQAFRRNFGLYDQRAGGNSANRLTAASAYHRAKLVHWR